MTSEERASVESTEALSLLVTSSVTSYSYLNATIGSTRDARRAGTKLATSATPARRREITDEGRRVGRAHSEKQARHEAGSASAAARPTAIPITASTSPAHREMEHVRGLRSERHAYPYLVGALALPHTTSRRRRRPPTSTEGDGSEEAEQHIERRRGAIDSESI